MKFWIDKGTTIYLFQLMKAAKFHDDYKEIRHIINKGQVTVNGHTVLKQRFLLKNNDEVRFKENYVKVLERNVLNMNSYNNTDEPVGNVRHGNTKLWRNKDIDLNYELEYQIRKESKKLHKIMLKTDKTLSVAESCTGGLIQEIITRNSGCSKYFPGGVVTYSNKSKSELISVDRETIKKFGAVSSETAEEMAYGVQKLFHSDYAASVTGIAGPEGGTEKNPVGTVYLAIIIGDNVFPKKLELKGNRTTIRIKTALELYRFLTENIE